MPKIDVETAGANFGIAGSLLLALAIPASKWGWCLFLASNCFWLVFAYRMKFNKLLVQTIVFACTSALGILNSFWPDNVVQASITKLFS
jgi:hypothetical protein